MRNAAKVLFSLAASVAGVAGSSAVAGAAPRSGGPVQVWVTVDSSTTNSIVVTGAIADYGSVTAIDKNGKVDGLTGNYLKITLKKGSVLGDATGFYKEHPNTPWKWDEATCSGTATESGPVTLSKGTGAYAGISGVITITTRYAVVGLVKNGRCDETRGDADAAGYGATFGSGTVSFQ